MKDKNIGFVKNGIYVIEKTGFPKDVPAFVFGESKGVFSGGDNSFIDCINNSSIENLFDYISILEQKGYSKVFDNKIGDNHFYSFTNLINLIFVYYIDNLKSVKLIAEPYYEFSYHEPIENIATPSVITSSACDRNYYIRLPNNKLVVIDGGWRIEDRSRYDIKDLLFEMYKEMVEICGNEHVNIPLWIITHAHTDHVRVLEYLYQMPFLNKFTIDRILYNFPDNDHLVDREQAPQEKILASEKQLKEWHERASIDYPYEDIFYNCPFPVYDTMNYEDVCRNAFNQYDAIQIKAHDGMMFNLSGVIFEVLHTPDDDMPTIYEMMNDTSLVIKMTYQKNSTIWLGDMGVIPGDSCIEMYGDYLRCDAVQVSHHGWGSASWEFFKLLNPTILLWNNSEFGFQYADKYQGYGKTESSTKLFNMPCVKQNYFCNTIKMQYIDMPFNFDYKEDNSTSKLLVSAASDKTFMIKLQNGKLILINGGWRKEMWDKYDHNKLLNNLFDEMKKLSENEIVTIAAFILTDKENNQFINNLNQCDFKDKILIENIIYNQDLNKDINSNYIIANPGECFDFDGALLNVLYSKRNSTTVVKLNINDKKIIFTGNMTDAISEEILSNDIDINCNIVQVANCGYNNCGVLDFYKKCNASINIWNTSEYAYRFFSKNEGYEKSDVSTSVYNFEHCKENYFSDRILPQTISLDK